MLQVLGSIPTWEREGVLGYDCIDQAHEEIHSSQLFPWKSNGQLCNKLKELGKKRVITTHNHTP